MAPTINTNQSYYTHNHFDVHKVQIDKIIGDSVDIVSLRQPHFFTVPIDRLFDRYHEALDQLKIDNPDLYKDNEPTFTRQQLKQIRQAY